MNINFTGIKNIGYDRMNTSLEFYNQDDEFDNEDDMAVASPPQSQSLEGNLLNLQLTDDFKGKHLSGFKDALKKSGLNFNDYKHPINKDFLNIYLTNDVYEDESVKEHENIVYVNDKEIPLEDKTLPVFSYIAKLLTEITQKPEKDFIVNRDYMKSEELRQGFLIGEDLSDTEDEYYTPYLEDAHKPSAVKHGANVMKDIVMKFMTEYFR